LATFRLGTEGVLVFAPLSWRGVVTLDGTGLDIPGTAQVPSFHLTAEGLLPPGGGALSRSGRGAVDARGRVGEGASFHLEAPTIHLPTAPPALTDLHDLHLEGDLDAHEIRISSISGAFPDARAFSGSGRATLDPLLAEADLDLRLTRPVDAVRAAAITASLRAGVLTLDAPTIDTDAGPATLHAVVPLGALRRISQDIPQLADALASLPFEPAPGLVSVQLAAPSLDSASLLAALGQPARPERLRAGLSADLTFDPAAPAAGRGTVRVDGLTVETPDGRAAADGPLTLRLGEGKVELLPAHVRVAGAGLDTAGFDLRGSALLAAGWRPSDDPPAAVVRDVTFAAGGTIDASLLNPFLEGGAASGILTLSAEASGPLDHLDATLRASGPGASFFWASPYATRVQDPDLAVRMRDGRWTVERGRVELNGGTVDLAGGGSLGGPVSLEATLAGIRYRFDYGLTALLRGTLSFQVPAEPEGRMRLAGRIVVDRGVLDRDVNLDREVLDLFLKKPATPGTEQTALDAIDLDLQIATVDGVRVRNNVADLRASWRPISITGTAATPVIQGQIDIDPGGLLEAYGQTVRIDRGAFIFKGDPLLDPKIDLATTSSLDDPTIGQLRGQERPLDLLTGRSAEEGKGFETEKLVKTGLAGYLGDRFASRLGESVGVEHLSLRPVLVFGETDPSARLTVGGDVSQNVSFALSVDLRNAESRTYLLDLHGFRELPGFALQGFTNDAGNEGGSFQQVLELGGSAPPAERRPRLRRPRLRRLRLDLPAGISKRALRRAIRLQKKEPVPESAAFDVEVDAAEFLRRKGYPDPKVTVDVTPAGGGKVDVAVAVEPGPHVRFDFAGDRPPRGERAAITTLYRTDFYEPVARAEMEKAAVRAFRRTGHLEPTVEIEVNAGDAGDAARTVVIRSAAGPRVRLSGLEIAGVDPESAFLAARRFPGPLERAELAAALPDADRRLLDTLRTLGYPHARVAGRERDGARLAVRVEPGERQRLGAVTVTGVEPEEARRLASLPALLRTLRPGAPARQDQAAAGALLLERDLADRGFPDAAVRSALRPSAPPAPGTPGSTGEPAVDLVYEVAAGPRVRIAGVGFTGERWSRPAQLARLAALPVGETFAAGDVEAARGRLLDTGVFSRVTAEVDRSAAPGEARVTFSVTESPRFHLGYGLRSVSGGTTAAVFDVIDRNLLGRAMTLGLRALWEPDDRSGRLYLQTGGLFGTPFSVESYVQDRHRDAGENLVEDSREAALQVARPFGAALTGRLYARYRATHLFEEEPDPFFPFDLQIDRPYLGAQALWDTRSDRVDPVTGLFASADLSGSGSFLGSDFDYARLYAQLNLYRPAALAGRRFVWAQSVRAGVARAFAGQELLREERFFAGGAFSVRGYDTESLGPEERLGSLVRPLGGEALLIVNEELRFPLPFDLTGLLFADAGQVWDTLGDVDADLSVALGLGLRARTPLGLLRLDAGFPLDPRPGDSRYKLYFGFGHAF
jgi:outer membrane protein assembly factor BamA